MRNLSIAAVAATALFSACSSGGSSNTSGMSNAGAQIPAASETVASVAASAILSSAGAPQLKSSVRLPAQQRRRAFTTLATIRRTLGYSIAKVEVDGTLYPGYAGTYSIANMQIVPVVNNATSVSMTFSNVPVGNNEWAIFDFSAIAPDNSKFYLGSFGKIVNVIKGSSNTIALNAPSTQNMQALVALEAYGIIDANDLATTPNLETLIQQQLTAQGIVPNPTTQLLTGAGLNAFINAESPKYQHLLTITPPAGATSVSVVADDTNVAEANMHLWPWYIFQLDQYYYDANPLAGFPSATEPARVPTVGPVPANAASVATILNIPPGKPFVIPVYGGPLIVGATNSQPPFAGQWAAVTSRNPGTANVTLPALAASQTTISATDPQDWAFHLQPNVSVQKALSTPGGNTVVPYGSYALQTASLNSSATGTVIAIDTWNPWKNPLSSYTLCDTSLDCQPASATTLFAITPVFGDPGSDLGWYGWSKSDSATGVTQSTSPAGYAIAYAGGLTVSATSSRPTRFLPQQRLRLVSYYQPNGQSYQNALPLGTLFTMSFVDSSGTTYTSTTVIDDEYSYLQPLQIASPLSATSTKLTFTLPSGSAPTGTIIVSSLE